MYTRQEASQLKQAFWTTFGQYMAPVLSAEGEKINWVNYKTGEKGISFRLEADNKEASAFIELNDPDPGMQQLYFEQFEQLSHLFNAEMGPRWTWNLHMNNEYGKIVSRIGCNMLGISVLNKEDWPQLISFFKEKITALDAFWSQVKYSFEALR